MFLYIFTLKPVRENFMLEFLLKFQTISKKYWNVIKAFATYVATGAPLSPNLSKLHYDRTFFKFIFHYRIRKFQSVTIYQKVITELCVHILFKIFKTAKNMKFKT